MIFDLLLSLPFFLFFLTFLLEKVHFPAFLVLPHYTVSFLNASRSLSWLAVWLAPVFDFDTLHNYARMRIIGWFRKKSAHSHKCTNLWPSSQIFESYSAKNFERNPKIWNLKYFLNLSKFFMRDGCFCNFFISRGILWFYLWFCVLAVVCRRLPKICVFFAQIGGFVRLCANLCFSGNVLFN